MPSKFGAGGQGPAQWIPSVPLFVYVERFAPPTQPNLAWLPPLETPVRVPRNIGAHAQMVAAANVVPLPKPPSYDWFTAFAEPVRVNLASRMAPQLYPHDFVYFRLPNSPVRMSVVNNATAPVFSKTVLYQSYAAGPLITLPNPTLTVSVDMWFAHLADPVRTKPRLDTGLQNFMDTMGSVKPEVSFSWAYPWHDPMRRLPQIGVQNQQAMDRDWKPMVSFSWMRPMEEPKRFPATLIAGLQRYDAREEVPIPPLQATIAWLRQMNEPVRVAPRLHAALNPELFRQPLPVVSFSWMKELEQPVRLKPGLPVTSQLAFTIDAYPWEPKGWWPPFEQPVRQRPQLPAALQPSEPTVFVPVYLPYAKDGPLYGEGTKSAASTLWRGRKVSTTLNWQSVLYVVDGYWQLGETV